MRGQSWTASLGLGSGAAAATPAWQLRWTSRAPGTRRSACFRKRPPCSFVTTALLEGRHSPCGPSLSLALPCPSLSFAISLATVDHDCTRRRAQALRADEYYTKVFSCLLLDEQSISILPRGPVGVVASVPYTRASRTAVPRPTLLSPVLLQPCRAHNSSSLVRTSHVKPSTNVVAPLRWPSRSA